jgi:hypothetical protein
MPDKPNTAEPQTPRRRWFQFRLRTLLIGVVLLGAACGYVAREARIVAARRNWLTRHRADSYDEFLDLSTEPMLPPVRRLLGDERAGLMVVRNPADEVTAKELFPEAVIICGYDVPNQGVGD